MSKTLTPESAAETLAGWQAAGRQIAPMLGSYSAAVVTGADPLAAAHVALGIGFAEAEQRRVAIGDLVGELPPLQSLISSDDLHGISDSFMYGVSLSKIGHPIDTRGNLFIMPSGTGSVADEEIYRNGRWQRLANGFREVGALLLLVAPVDAPALRELVDQMEGVVLVGQTEVDARTHMNVLARVPTPTRSLGRRRSGSGPVSTEAPRRKRWPWIVAGIVLLATLCAGAAMYWQPEAIGKILHRRSTPAPKPTPKPAAVAVPPETLVVNPPPPPSAADSADLAEYAVELGTWSSLEDAQAELRRREAALPAGTVSPVPMGPRRETYYKVIAGAFPSRGEAAKLLSALIRQHIVSDSVATVVRTPYALRIDSADAGHTQDLVRKYAGFAQSIYVLAQPNGRIVLYAGAFERPEDAVTLLATLRRASVAPVLVYRTGRTP